MSAVHEISDVRNLEGRLAGIESNADTRLDSLELKTNRPRIVAYRGNHAYSRSNGTITSGTSRTRWLFPNACYNFAPVYANYYQDLSGNEVNGDNVVDYKASVEDFEATTGSIAGGTLIPFSFGGKLTANLAVGAIVAADPMRYRIAAGWNVFIRTNADVSAYGASAKFTLNQQTYPSSTLTYPSGAGISEGYDTNSDKTATGTVTATGVNVPAPIARVGFPVANNPAIAIFGDSIAYGSGYLAVATMSWTSNACIAAGIPYVNLSIPGMSNTLTYKPSKSWRRFQLLRYCTHVLDQLGVNDLFTNSLTLAQMQALKISYWDWLNDQGLKVIACTITPDCYDTANSDGFHTATNQTPVNSTQEAIRVLLNAWIRTSPHPAIVKVLDPCAVVEANSSNVLTVGGGRWYAPGQGATTTFTATGGTSTTITNSGASWTTNQFQYNTVKITSGTGAGQINQVLSNTGTVLSFSTAFGVTPDNTSVIEVGQAYTYDGIHPTTAGHDAMSTPMGVALTGLTA